LDRARDFYHHVWGMGLIGVVGDEVAFRSREADHAELLLRQGDAARLDHVAFSVASEDALRALVDALESHGHTIDEAPRPGRRAGEALVAAFPDLDGNRIELVVPTGTEVPEATFEGDAAGPLKLGHVVLWTPRQDAQEAFYALLGLRVTDRTHIGMSFLRCNRDHHTLATVKSDSGRTGIQHIAFDVGSLDTVMREAARMRDDGNPCIWGVGRHGPGNNIFSYYQDPAGNVVEYYGDMEQVEAGGAVEERYWGPEHKGDIWGMSGPPPAPFRD
jgi:catechol 2,3-dioxygenase-like lactoylglutathione lyase family enzyme